MPRSTGSRLPILALAFAVTAIAFSTRSALAQCATITVQPRSQSICIFPGGAGVFTVTATGSNLTYQWQQQDLGDTFPTGFLDIHDGPVYDPVFGVYVWFTASGTDTNQLTLSDAQGYAQVFRCVVTGACGPVESNEVYLVYCQADFNCDGQRTVADIFAFLSAWFAQAGSTGPGYSADFNFDGEVSVADIFAFLSAWFEGCD